MGRGANKTASDAATDILYGTVARTAQTDEQPKPDSTPMSLSQPQYTSHCQGRNKDYDYVYIVTYQRHNRPVIAATFESEQDAQAMVVDQNRQDPGSEWKHSRQTRFHAGSRMEKREVHHASWSGKLTYSDQPEIQAQEWADRPQEDQIPDQVISGSYLIIKEKTNKGRQENRFIVCALDPALATEIRDAESEKYEEELRTQAEDRQLRRQKEKEKQAQHQALHCPSQDEKNERHRKKMRRRIARLAAQGLPAGHVGPTDPDSLAQAGIVPDPDLILRAPQMFQAIEDEEAFEKATRSIV